jgi:hypothetical protein
VKFLLSLGGLGDLFGPASEQLCGSFSPQSRSLNLFISSQQLLLSSLLLLSQLLSVG